LSEIAKCVSVYDGSNLFPVTDIDEKLSCLKSGKASGLDDLYKGNIM